MATKVSSRFASLFLIFTVLLSIILTGCASQAVPQETTTPLPTETSAPTATAKPTLTQAPTKKPTLTKTSEPTATEAPGVKSEVYTFDEFNEREVSFEELPFIDYEDLKADDLSQSVEVDSSIMAEAISAQTFNMDKTSQVTFINVARNDPNFQKYQEDKETRPYETLRAYRTTIDGKDYAGMIVAVKNADGSVTLLKTILPSYFAQKENAKSLNEQLNNGKITNWAYTIVNSGFWNVKYPFKYVIGEYYSSWEELEQVSKLLAEWKATGIAPKELGNYALLLGPLLW